MADVFEVLGVDRAPRVMLTGVSSSFARDDNHKSATDGYYPFMNRRIQVVGYALAENHQ